MSLKRTGCLVHRTTRHTDPNNAISRAAHGEIQDSLEKKDVLNNKVFTEAKISSYAQQKCRLEGVGEGCSTFVADLVLQDEKSSKRRVCLMKIARVHHGVARTRHTPTAVWRRQRTHNPSTSCVSRRATPCRRLVRRLHVCRRYREVCRVAMGHTFVMRCPVVACGMYSNLVRTSSRTCRLANRLVKKQPHAGSALCHTLPLRTVSHLCVAVKQAAMLSHRHLKSCRTAKLQEIFHCVLSLFMMGSGGVTGLIVVLDARTQKNVVLTQRNTRVPTDY